MRRVETYSQGLAVLRQPVQHRAQVLKIVSERVAPANVIFQEQERHCCIPCWLYLGQDGRNGLGDAGDSRLEAGAAMAARVEDHIVGLQESAALQCPAQ